MNDRCIQLPNYGRLIVVTDIHGNWNDWLKYITEIWDKDDENCHILFTGDLIHGDKYSEDMSIDILQDIDEYYYNLPNFHVLLGNHELAQIQRDIVYKYEDNQVDDFVRHIEDHCSPAEDPFLYQVMWEETLKTWKWCAMTHNGLFIIHAGPHDIAIQKLQEHGNTFLTMNTDYSFSRNEYALDILYDFIWSRPWDDYTPSLVDLFLESVKCHTMLVGHTPAGTGYGVFGNQIIMSSSYGGDRRKCYLDMPLNANINNVDDVVKYIKVLK